MQRSIQKLELTKLASGESDPGAVEGLTLRRTRIYTGLGVGADETHVFRFYDDDTSFPGWLPTSEASLYAWLDATVSGSITESSGDVSAIADQSGNGNHFVTGTAPRTGDNTLNSLNVLTFTSPDFLQRAVTDFPDTLILTMTAQITAVTNAFAALFTYNAITTNDWRFRAGSSSAFNGFLESDLVGGGGGGFALTSPPHPGPSVYSIVFDLSGGTAEVFIDGTSYGSAAYATGFDASGTLYLFTNENVFHLSGYFAELAIFGGTASDTVRQKAEGYQAHKWGLVANLPDGHPYKAVAPTT